MFWEMNILAAFLAGTALAWLWVMLRKRRAPITQHDREIERRMAVVAAYLHQHPCDAAAHMQMGLLRGHHGDPRGALLELERSVELAPESTEAHYHLGAARQRLGNRRGAEREFRWVLEHSEDPYYRTAARGGLLALRRAA
jgi:tetratricopeptide (TPR) repeat protein